MKRILSFLLVLALLSLASCTQEEPGAPVLPSFTITAESFAAMQAAAKAEIDAQMAAQTGVSTDASAIGQYPMADHYIPKSVFTAEVTEESTWLIGASGAMPVVYVAYRTATGSAIKTTILLIDHRMARSASPYLYGAEDGVTYKELDLSLEIRVLSEPATISYDTKTGEFAQVDTERAIKLSDPLLSLRAKNRLTLLSGYYLANLDDCSLVAYESTREGASRDAVPFPDAAVGNQRLYAGHETQSQRYGMAFGGVGTQYRGQFGFSTASYNPYRIKAGFSTPSDRDLPQFDWEYTISYEIKEG